MSIDYSPLITRAKGPILMHSKPGYLLYRDWHGTDTIRPRRVGMGPGGQHPNVIFCQQAWNILDKAWIAMSREQRALWGKCTKKTATLTRSNLDEFRSINLNRMLLGWQGMTTPQDAFASQKVYLTNADRPSIPPGKVIAVWTAGKDKNGDPFPPPAQPIELPELEPPYPPAPVVTCPMFGWDHFDRPDCENLGECWNQHTGLVGAVAWRVDTNMAVYWPIHEFDGSGVINKAVADNMWYHVVLSDLKYWAITEGDEFVLHIFLHLETPTGSPDGRSVGLHLWPDQELAISLYNILEGDFEEIDFDMCRPGAPDGFAAWLSPPYAYGVALHYPDGWERYALSSYEYTGGLYSGFGFENRGTNIEGLAIGGYHRGRGILD